MQMNKPIWIVEDTELIKSPEGRRKLQDTANDHKRLLIIHGADFGKVLPAVLLCRSKVARAVFGCKPVGIAHLGSQTRWYVHMSHDHPIHPIYPIRLVAHSFSQGLGCRIDMFLPSACYDSTPASETGSP